MAAELASGTIDRMAIAPAAGAGGPPYCRVRLAPDEARHIGAEGGSVQVVVLPDTIDITLRVDRWMTDSPPRRVPAVVTARGVETRLWLEAERDRAMTMRGATGWVCGRVTLTVTLGSEFDE